MPEITVERFRARHGVDVAAIVVITMPNDDSHEDNLGVEQAAAWQSGGDVCRADNFVIFADRGGYDAFVALLPKRYVLIDVVERIRLAEQAEVGQHINEMRQGFVELTGFRAELLITAGLA